MLAQHISETPKAGWKKFYEKISFEQAKLLLGLVGSSLFLEEVTYWKEDNPIYPLKRPVFNATLSSPIHNFKSTMLKGLEDSYRSARVEDLTFAGAIGSVDSKTHTATEPFFWQSNGKLALIDEFEADEKGQLTQGFLKIMEWEPFGRNTASEVAVPKRKHGKLGTYFRVVKGKIEILSKGVVILATMDSPQFLTRSKRGEALADRSLMIYYNVSNQESDDMILKYSQIAIPVFKPSSPVVHLTEEETKEVFRHYSANFEQVKNPRAFEEMVRAYAVLGRHDFDIYRLIAKTKKPLWFKPREDDEETVRGESEN